MHPYTLEELVETYSRYPKRIQNAILRARTHPTITSSLTKASINVLTAFLTRASARNGLAPLKARVNNVAEEASVSEKTVQRAIATFRELGWMALATEEARNENGEFCFRVYQFTLPFCKLVALPCPEDETPVAVTPSETKLSDGAVYVDLTFKEDQRKMSIQKHQGRPVTLPAELEAVCAEFNLKPTGMAKLRGIAHQAGHDLSAIVTVARDYLKKTGATGNRVYRYLLTMALKADNYTARAEQIARQATASQEQKEAQTLAASCRYKQFIGPNGLSVKVYDGNAEVISNGKVVLLGGSQLQRIYDMVKAGVLHMADSSKEAVTGRAGQRPGMYPARPTPSARPANLPQSMSATVPMSPRSVAPAGLAALRAELSKLNRRHRGLTFALSD